MGAHDGLARRRPVLALFDGAVKGIQPMNLLKSPAACSMLLAAALGGCAQPQQKQQAASPTVAARAQTPAPPPQARTSAAWNQRLTAAVMPNIDYPDAQPRPSQTAEFTVFMSPDGTITDKTLLNASGNPQWDRAASLALRTVSRLPVDDSGKAPYQALIAIGAAGVSAVVIQHTPPPPAEAGGYAGRIAAALRQNMVYASPEEITGNPAAVFDLELAPDGTIASVAFVQSSGWPDWDEAARRGILKTERLPRDIDGKVPARLRLTLRPKR